MLENTMKIKSIITYILSGVSLTSILLASGIREVANWWDIARPFFAVWFVTLLAALIITNINLIRRITYPVLVCVSSWAYKHKLIKTEFTKNTYKLYKWKHRSYSELYDYVQDLFDVMYN